MVMTFNAEQKYIEAKKWDVVPFGEFDRIEDIYFRSELLRCGLDLTQELQILEFGFGNGSFAGWARQNHFSYCGIEELKVLLVKAGQAGYQVFDSKTPLHEVAEPATLDLIVAFDVFEHIAIMELETLLCSVHHLLKTDGVILARVPSGDSPFGGAIYFGDLTHKTLLGSLAIRYLASICSFDVVEIGSPKLPIKQVGLVRGIKRFFIVVGQKILGRLIQIVFHGNRKSVITENLIFVWKKKARNSS